MASIRSIFIDGIEKNTTPNINNEILVGEHEIELKVTGYKPYRQIVEIIEGKIERIEATLEEEEKTGSLRITANVPAVVNVDGKHVGYTPITLTDLSLGKKKVSFEYSGYRGQNKTVIIVSGNNNLHGELEKKIHGPSNAFLSILVPGLGVHKVTGKEKNGVGRAVAVYGIVGASIGCKLWSNSEYKKYHDATEQSVMDKHYNMANGLNKAFYIGMTIGATIWLYDIIWVAAKGAKNRKEQKPWQQGNLGFYYNPKLNVSGLSYTINF